MTPALHGNAAAVQDTVRAWYEGTPRGVVFDFNGTLSDDEPILLDIFTELFDAVLGWRMSPAEYFARYAGRSDREIIEIAVAEHGGEDRGLVRDLLQIRRTRYQQIVAEHSPIRPGTVALVDRLAAEGIPMAIVTGAQRDDVRCVLASSPVGDRITVMVTEEDVEHGKPHPEGFLRGAALLGVHPADILAFEDSVHGYTGATSAGMRCVMVEGTHAASELASVTRAVVTALDPAVLDI